jgi:1,4-dihydroxy-2-naphthoate polyprenyltransferase
MNLKNTFSLRPWIMAARLKTLPLAASNIILGSFLAYFEGTWSLFVLFDGLLTALLLQIISNFANDYGDFVSGADKNRNSTLERALQSGKISRKQMKSAIIVMSVLALISGIMLIASGAKSHGMSGMLGFLGLGILSILAAITYTVGKKPYGYIGLGDIAVFLFFGIVGVSGIFILHTHQWQWSVLLPAASLGLLSAGVLNINNIRDIDSDKQSGKNTLVVRLGIKNAKIYHTWLIIVAVGLGVTSTLINYHSVLQLIYLLTFPFFYRNIHHVHISEYPAMFDKELRNLSLTTFFYSFMLGIGFIL